MATTKSQRLGILIILIVTVVGTIGSFAVLILTTKNQSDDAARLQKVQNEYQAKVKVYQAQKAAQADELSAKYYPTFSQFGSRVGAYDIESNNKTLQTQDLLVGDGEEVTDTTKFAAYYILWLPRGTIQEQSIDPASGKLKSPLAIDGLATSSLIQGWKEGMKGMRLGGVRELTIPSDKGYKEQGTKDQQGNEVIPPNTPLKFIVMAIPAAAEIAPPTYPMELFQGLGQ